MHCLEKKGRLFTYKVAADRGSAPNPYGGICTLAICKPNIRRVAKPGDIVVGLGCRDSRNPDEEFRIVYVMQVGERVGWAKYIAKCEKELKEKIPTGANHPGDCIYRLDSNQVRCSSWSLHTNCDYPKDVERGEYVLLSDRGGYWYFGGGDQFKLCVPANYHGFNLREIVPNRGHRSDKNDGYQDRFIEWFNDQLKSNTINAAGMHGSPKMPAPGYAGAQHVGAGKSASCSTSHIKQPAVAVTSPTRRRGCS